MSETVSRAEYARRLGVNRSSVTRWADEGRVVMVGKLVDVEASDARLQETGGARPDVAARHAEGRPASGQEDHRQPVDQASGMIGDTYQASRAMREKYGALRAQAEYEQMIGNLIARSDVDAAMMILGAAVRASLDVLPDQATPLVAPVTDLHEVHALLADACRNVLHGLEEAVKREQRRMRMEGTA